MSRMQRRPSVTNSNRRRKLNTRDPGLENIYEQEAISRAYQLFIAKLGISKEDDPVIFKDKKKLILHSRNFCPTLEACKILNLDTWFVCRHLSEKPTTDLLRRLHPKLRFTRNYEKLRPFVPYCKEMIALDE